MIRLPEGDPDASQHVGVLTIFKIIYIYIYIYVCVCVCVYCAFLGLDIKKIVSMPFVMK